MLDAFSGRKGQLWSMDSLHVRMISGGNSRLSRADPTGLGYVFWLLSGFMSLFLQVLIVLCKCRCRNGCILLDLLSCITLSKSSSLFQNAPNSRNALLSHSRHQRWNFHAVQSSGLFLCSGGRVLQHLCFASRFLGRRRELRPAVG